MAEWRDRSDRLIHSLVQAKDEAFRLNLLQTGLALDEAVRRVGWEVAERLVRKRDEPGEHPLPGEEETE